MSRASHTRAGHTRASRSGDVQAGPCRPVTADEVDHLHEHGWVKLQRFVDPEVLAATLELARAAMGDDADSNPIPPGFEKAAAEGKFGLD